MFANKGKQKFNKSFGSTWKTDGQFKNKGFGGGNDSTKAMGSGVDTGTTSREDTSEIRIHQSIQNDAVDNKFGFKRIKGNLEKMGWLLNMHSTEVMDEDRKLISAVDFYFLEEDGGRFRATMAYKPYFYILPKLGFEKEITLFLTKKYGSYLTSIEVVQKEDLDLPNHLVGLKQKYLKLSFINVSDLMRVRRDILPAVRKNREREKSNSVYSDLLKKSYVGTDIPDYSTKSNSDNLDNILDIREYDVPYHMRVCIDNSICAAVWYSVKLVAGRDFEPEIVFRPDIIESPDCIVLAYDIETTKLPLKFPDNETDQIIMISYMIDAEGFLITNREVVSSDVDDFEYTPTPEFEGQFTVFNEPNEKSLIQRFFDHILDIKPHIFATYNGDFFDWPFVEARAQVYGLSMFTEIGVSSVSDGIYSSRPCIHMDCFNWVKRDSYLPVGSQNLKAVAKAKLRYNPVELDPEDMCRMAAEQPQILSNYSVSDAVATYYLYMKYVHPFIFALCTIIPMEPDEVLRKGSGTLCEALLMVEGFQANIIFPNKQESILNKMSEDGHVLDQETYVGGHVEALESGVFRSDIATRFKLDPETFQKLIAGVECTLRHTIEEEEKIPLEKVINFEEVAQEIKLQLTMLCDNPMRHEFPVIYHLDVGAMYPNIILTNRLQPSAMVNEAICASCDFNKPGAKCQREMAWTWRGEVIPASRAEFQRIQQQLEMEKFPPAFPGGPIRAFHQLTKEERAQFEKKRVSDYSRKVYKKAHITRVETRTQTICQQENSFYVDTVRAFRDRRYEYKALNKAAKNQVADAIASGDAAVIKSAKSREILYDSLQLAHKCILNSFYGYVMRRGARWFSMEMAGIVCHTGSNIIKKAREIIEKVGRPLELDTDGIWCILPSSFPQTVVIRTSLEKKAKITISYPNAVLNQMVKDEFTNDQYHELVNAETLEYKIRQENSIFFEVDGPYLAMILPASKEEGKKLKKRYAVFNKDKSLAELKGFEVKRRGELHLIKIFQSSVFESFLDGDSLESCFASVAKVADYWLDVLYSKAEDMPDAELFELISENRNMSRKLEDYGSQKSTSISTAKRLAEFLGDQMVKDAGLSCRFIISRKPEGSPVTERAIPLAIFQAESSVKKHYLRRWLKDSSIVDFDIRRILDWDYYIQRIGGSIQKIITIPAAMQGVPNPVPRVCHPDWLHKKILEKTDVLKQRKINEVFKRVPKPITTGNRTENGDGTGDAPDIEVLDIEDTLKAGSKERINRVVINSTKKKRNRSPEPQVDYTKPWVEVLGLAPPIGTTKNQITKWLIFHKKKWEFLRKQKAERSKRLRLGDGRDEFLHSTTMDAVSRRSGPVTIGGFLRRNQQTLLNTPWQVLQIAETATPGLFRLWALVGQEMHQVKLHVPRIFYVNVKEPRNIQMVQNEDGTFSEVPRKCTRTLPRSHPVYNLYEYTVPETIYKNASSGITAEVSSYDVEGIYETQVPLDFRAIVQMGCVCSVDRKVANKMREISDSFELSQLNFCSISSDFPYMDLSVLKYVFIYQHKSGNKNFIGVIFPTSSKGTIYVIDTVRSNQMPHNLTSLYNQHRNERLKKGDRDENLPGENCTFDVVFETNMGNVYRHLQRLLQSYKDERKGPTVLCIQSVMTFNMWTTYVPVTTDYPMIPIHIYDSDNAYNVLDWQRIATRILFTHFFRLRYALDAITDQCRYLQIPIGNMKPDPTLFGCDILYARALTKQGFTLWCSATERPDFGGREADDSRLITEFEDSNGITINNPGSYQSVCMELEIDGLAVDTLLQAPHVHDIEGTAATVAFDNLPQASLEEMMGNTAGPMLANYDETALCSGAFRVLRSMVTVWLKDVSTQRNLMADYQLVHMYRWLRSPHALLYDPALKKSLHNLMKKLFIQFAAEFTRLGSTIIYADFSKIIICTKKNRLEDALTYIEYVSASIKSRELFHGIDVRVKDTWDNLLWLDQTNYGGMKGIPAKVTPKDSEEQKSKRKSKSAGNDDSSSDESDEENENELEVLNLSEDEEEVEIDMHWRLVNYLPDIGNCKINFGTAIASYITAVYEHLRNELDGFLPGETPVRRRKATQTPRRAHDNPIAMNTVQYSKELIRGELSQKLFHIIERLNKKYPSPITEGENQNGIYKGTLTYKAGKPALEFVKLIYLVLSLDANIEDEAYKLRRDLLKLIGVGEFSEKSQWADPCHSVLVPEVICKLCILCRDIDLTKDEFVRMENDLPVWYCPTCKSDYETSEIEQTLVDTLSRRLMGFMLQDTQCEKCRQIKQDNLTIFCSCAGSMKTVMDSKQMIARLEAYKGLAQHFGMPLLQQNVEWLLKMNTICP